MCEASEKLRAAAIKTAQAEGFKEDETGYLAAPCGRFEGEPYYALHYYDRMANGEGQAICVGEDVVADVFEVTDVEREAFGFKDSTVAVFLFYHDSGFITFEEHTAQTRDKILADYAEEEAQHDTQG